MNDGNFIKAALHYGALCGIGIFIFYMMLYFLGFSIFGEATMLGIWIPIVFIVLAVKHHRNVNLGGAITYRQGLSMGMMTTIFSATLFGLAFYIFIMLFDQSVVDTYKTQAAASIEEGKGVLLSESMYEKAMESIEVVTAGSLAFSESFNKIIGGAVISLIVAGVLRRKPENDEMSQPG